jgi:hypothetical protein
MKYLRRNPVIYAKGNLLMVLPHWQKLLRVTACTPGPARELPDGLNRSRSAAPRLVLFDCSSDFCKAELEKTSIVSSQAPLSEFKLPETPW